MKLIKLVELVLFPCALCHLARHSLPTWSGPATAAAPLATLRISNPGNTLIERKLRMPQIQGV